MPQPLDHQPVGLYGQPSNSSVSQEALPDLVTFPLILRSRRQKQGFELKILYGVEWFDPESITNPFPLTTIKQLIETLIPLEFCLCHRLIPLCHEQDASLLVIAMVKPDDLIAQDKLRQILNSKEFMVQRRVITPEDFLRILSDYSDKVSGHHRTHQLHIKTTCLSKPQDTDYLLLEEPDDEVMKQLWTM